MAKIHSIQIWIEKKFTKKKIIILTLAAIIFFGILARTYHHRAWLYFDDDQANDAIVVRSVIENHATWPLLGPNMGNTKFYLGPIYNYFQIISANIFGDYPDKLAYPDLFFSILAIPLFYYFLKKFFSVNLSLALTGLYTFSYFAIKFSRFAWNTNPMPFFILLFLLAIFEFFYKKEKASWFWAVLLGIALGVGVQLHAMLLVIFPLIFLAAVIWNLKSGWRIWTKWLAVFFVAILLNGGQIYFEFTHNFQNSKNFFSNAGDRSGSSASKFVNSLAQDAACHIQANAFILTTWGNKDNCDFLSLKKNGSYNLAAFDHPEFASLVIFSIIFSILGYGLLVKNFKDEREKDKKYFLAVIIIYLILFFAVMLPSIQAAPLRYFLPIFFLPYLFLGFFIVYLKKKFPKNYFFLSIGFILVISASNILYLLTVAAELENKTRSGTSDVILGEIEPMNDYIIRESYPLKTAYLSGGGNFIPRFYKPISVLAQMQGFVTQRANNKDLNPDLTLFYIYQSYPKKNMDEIKGMKILDYRNFGAVAVYKVIKNN